MSHRRRLFAGTLAVAMLVSALPGTAVGQSEPSSPEGVEWVLTSIDAAPLPADVSVTLSLADGVAVGNAGCNSYFGAYELDGPALTFPEPFGSTMMMCDETAMSVEIRLSAPAVRDHGLVDRRSGHAQPRGCRRHRPTELW